MIPKECKRLAEVGFPIAGVSQHAAQEKYVRRGHPSTLHLWWARRPLASSRGLLLPLLVPDPCDERCPESFKKKARQILLAMHRRPQGWTDAIDSDDGLQHIILNFITDFANWDRAADRTYLDVGRALVKAAHGEEPPLVVDPFAGGGSIPLEALRLGCDTFASDLNPVACLILKVMLEDIPRHGLALTEELRETSSEIKQQVEKELTELYPRDPDGAMPIVYLWARTVRCEAPGCGAEIPLLRSSWLRQKSKRKRALRYRIGRDQKGPPRVELDIFEPEADKEAPAGTVKRAIATCGCCGAALPPERVRAQLANQRGGADVDFDERGRRAGGARITAVVIRRDGQPGRHYRLPTDADYQAVRKARERERRILEEWKRDGKQGLCPVPDEPLPPVGTLGFRVQRYGMSRWGDLFTARQKVALLQFVNKIAKLPPGIKSTMLSLLMGKMADGNNSLTRWIAKGENPANLFARQAIPMVWDFCELTPQSNSNGAFLTGIDAICRVITSLQVCQRGQTQSADATDHPLPDQSTDVWFTDPPYYDAIPYSDLSDFFLVWFKRALPDSSLWRDPDDPDNLLSPKSREVVQDKTKTCEGRVKDRNFFEDAMGKAFAQGRRILKEDGIGSVVFAHKTTEGWEALLSGMIRGGWTVTGSWPLVTEMRSRLRAIDSAALASSVHLVCRPRNENAPVGDWADVLRELSPRVVDWMKQLQGEGIQGSDQVFACIGPALEIFSRYRVVETTEGNEIGLSEYLKKVWEVVSRTALKQVLGKEEGADMLEEDARLTALFLWTLKSTKISQENDNEEDENEAATRVTATGFSLPFDVVRRFAQPMGINLDTWTGKIIDSEKAVVRLLPVEKRAKELFGEEGVEAVVNPIEGDTASAQITLFPESDTALGARSRYFGKGRHIGDDTGLPTINATTLDRLHVAMLLQAWGRTHPLRNLLKAEQDGDRNFFGLANALATLYPAYSEEKRLIEAMLLATP